MTKTNCTIPLSHCKLMHKSLHSHFPPYPDPSRLFKSSTIAAIAITRAPGFFGGETKKRETKREISSKEGLILRHRGHNHTSSKLNSTRVEHSNIGAMRLGNHLDLGPAHT